MCSNASSRCSASTCELVDISGDAELEARHREQIPVVYVAGRKAFKYRVEPVELARRVVAASQSSAS